MKFISTLSIILSCSFVATHAYSSETGLRGSNGEGTGRELAARPTMRSAVGMEAMA